MTTKLCLINIDTSEPKENYSDHTEESLQLPKVF